MQHAGIKHLEDLKIKEFVHCVTNLNKFFVTEKIDGSELIFGLDENGKFYTSREAKSGKRFYSESKWPKQFWTTGFRGAHKALESNLNVLKLLMNPGDSIEIEVLYGPTPNTVPYNADGYNRIVFLRSITGNVDIKKLQDKINSCILRGLKLDVEGVPHTENGWDYSLDNIVEQHWKFETVPEITLGNYPEEIKENIKNLVEFLNKKSSNGKTNLEISEQRITNSNRQEVQKTRNKIQEYKVKIKNKLIETLVENRASVFGPTVENNGWIEGLVFRESETGFQFKLVNKSKFTKINTENHFLQSQIRENIWNKFKEDAYKIFNLTKDDKKKERIYFEDYKDLANRNFGKNIISMQAELQKLCWTYINEIQKEYRDLPNKKQYINESNQQRVLEEICGTKDRLMKICSKAFTATQMEHLIELVLTEEIEADQKKHFYHNTRRIFKHEINPTLKYLSKIIDVNYSYLKEQLLGSTGKTESNGDVDICLNADLGPHIRYNAKKQLAENSIFESKGLGIIHLIVPIGGKEENGNVQVDIMLSENPNWTKFYFDSDPNNSKYKGLYRNALLRAMVSATNQTRTTLPLEEGGGELIGRSGYVLVPSKGIEWQIRERPKSKNGGYVKAFQVVEKRSYANDPQRILDIIFNENICSGLRGKRIQLEDIRTFEGLLKLAKSHRHDIELVVEITKKILNDLKYKLPEELVDVL